MRRLHFLLAVTLVLGVSLAPVASATHLDVFLLTSKAVYEMGEYIQITLYAFQLGTPTELSPGPVLYTDFTGEREYVNMTRVGPGVFTANYTVSPGTLPLNFTRAWVSFRAEVVYANFQYVRQAVVIITQADALAVIDLSNDRPTVNETLTATVTTFRSGVPTDPTNLSVAAGLTLTSLFSYDPEMLNATRVDVGRYVTGYKVPVEAAGNRVYFLATVWFNDSALQTGAIANVRGLTLWYHRLGVEASNLSFELWVSTGDDRPAEGAFVRFDWQGERSGTTDAQGRVAFQVPLEGAGPFTLRGNVTHEGSYQAFSTSLFINLGLDIRPLVGSVRDLFFEPWSNISVPFEARLQGNVLGNATLGYVARTSRTVLAAGQVRTDAQGRFLLNLTTSDRTVRIVFQYDDSEGVRYGIGVRLFSETPGIRIDVDQLRLGGLTNVSLSVDPRIVGLPPWAGLFVLPLDEPYLSFQWVPLTIDPYAAFHIPLAVQDQAAVQVYLPPTLPLDRDYLFLAWFGYAEEPAEEVTLVLKAGEGTGTVIEPPADGEQEGGDQGEDGGGSGETFPLDLTTAFLGFPLYVWMGSGLAAAIALWVFQRRRRPKEGWEPAPQEQEVLEKSEEDRLDGQAEVAEEEENVPWPRP